MHFIYWNVENAKNFEVDCEFRGIYWKEYVDTTAMISILKSHHFFWFFFQTGVQAKNIYSKLNVKIEKMCDLIYLVLVDATLVGYILPALLITLVNCLIYGLKEKSYILPCQAM